MNLFHELLVDFGRFLHLDSLLDSFHLDIFALFIDLSHFHFRVLVTIFMILLHFFHVCFHAFSQAFLSILDVSDILIIIIISINSFLNYY